MKAQNFLHTRIAQLTHDYINNHRAAEVTGFAYSLGEGNAFTMTIAKPGRVAGQDGRQYELLADVTFTVAAADPDLPRVDLVCAVLEDDVDAELNLIPFVQLRTADEFSDEVPPYPPQNINAPTELHDRVVLRLKAGTPADVPTPPTHDSNEVPLYYVAVAPGATQLRDADVLDLRDVILTLRRINEMMGQSRIDISTLGQRVTELENIAGQPIDLSQIFGEIRTLGAILADLQRQITASRDVPEIRYDRPKVALTDKDSSKIIAMGTVMDTIPCVDIEIGGRINFGDAEVVITPYGFKSPALHPQYITIASGGDEHLRREVDLTYDNVTMTAGDGFIDFSLRLSEFTIARGRPGCAARDDQFVEVFGGLAADNSSGLGDWYTYDVINDTLTPRTPSITLPNSNRPAMFPYGDGVHVLLIAANETASTSPQRCFKINADTGVTVELTGTRPNGAQFFGDMITITGDVAKILVVAVKKTTGVDPDYWEFDTATDTFALLTTTGSVPTPTLDAAGGCYYGDNAFVMVTFEPATSGSGKTFVFNRGTLQWTQLTISSPYGDNPEKQLALTRFRMANVHGRPILLGGMLAQDSNPLNAKIWELKFSNVHPGMGLNSVLLWQSSDTTHDPLQDPGFCSTLGGLNVPDGKAFLFSGHGRYSLAHGKIYSSVQGGLIATSLDGLDGVSIGPSSTYVQFEVDSFTAAWDVASYLASVEGRFTSSSMKIEVSVDDGEHWHELENARSFTVTDSDDPAVRRLRFTLYQDSQNPPILTHLSEVLDGDGGEIEDRQVIRYFAPVLESGLYIDRHGIVTLSTTIVPSTPDKCLIHKVTPNGSSAPTLKNYINRRRPHVKYNGTKSGAAGSVKFQNELAVPIRYVDARVKKASDSSLYKIDDPTVAFDAEITLVGVATNGDVWTVELEG